MVTATVNTATLVRLRDMATDAIESADPPRARAITKRLREELDTLLATAPKQSSGQRAAEETK